MSESQKRERFGRYLILDHLVDGGMAKICRARFLGEQADKVVAIKMVQPQFSKDEAFKTMFMDEIKVTFGLIHPNVIQTYDYGLHKGQLFVAMEYCDGRNLKEYLEKLKERNVVFPLEISTYIISQACQGLYYAHTFRDKLTGQESNIIHRDISPHNIMLTYDGSIKIIDFGIAKSQTNSESTQAGTIKGKLSYLAPEYLEGMELDGRYDQFALGITLWEMLCSRKLFKENNDLAVLKKIQECKIPAPSSINPNVPKELDEIVLKALSKDRNDRFKDLDQFNRALMKFLYAKFPDFNSTDLSHFAQALFKKEIEKDREKMFEFGKIDLRPYLDDLKRDGGVGNKDSEPVEQIAPKSREKVLDFGFDPEAESKVKLTTPKKSSATPNPSSVQPQSLSGTNGIPVATKEKRVSTHSGGNPEANKALGTVVKTGFTRATKKPENTGTKTKVNRSKNNSSKKSSAVSTIAALLALVVGAASYIVYSLSEPEAPVVTVAPVKKSNDKNRLPAQSGQGGSEQDQSEMGEDRGKLVLAHFDKQKMQVFVDGKKKEIGVLSEINVPLAREFTLRVQIEGKRHFIKEMRVDNNSPVEVEIPEMQGVAYAYINTSGNCAQGELRFEILGEKRVSPIPMQESFGISFPLGLDEQGHVSPHTYQLYFKRAGEEIERKIEITLSKEDQSIDLCEQL